MKLLKYGIVAITSSLITMILLYNLFINARIQVNTYNDIAIVNITILGNDFIFEI